MKILRTKILKSDQDLVAYQQKVKEILGIEFPVLYLKQGQIRAFFNKKDELVAGYAFINQAPFRTLSSIPGKIPELPCNIECLSEVTALFIDGKVKSNTARCQFWLTFSREISNMPGKSHYIYAYDLEKTKLKKLYRMANPTVLFEGRTLFLEGMEEVGDEAIEVARCNTIMYLPFYGMPAILNKMFLKKPMKEIRFLLGDIGNIV